MNVDICLQCTQQEQKQGQKSDWYSTAKLVSCAQNKVLPPMLNFPYNKFAYREVDFHVSVSTILCTSILATAEEFYHNPSLIIDIPKL